MKTAEYWNHGEEAAQIGTCNCVPCRQLRKVQLDAMKDGMRRAATKASCFVIEGKAIHPDINVENMSRMAKVIYHTTGEHIAQDIQQAANNLTIADL